MVLNIKRKPYHLDVALKDLKLDKAIQMRASINRYAVLDYAEAYERGDKLPPPVVYWIPGQAKFVADGFHRVLALMALVRRGLKKFSTVRVLIRTGTKRDAMLYSAGCNRAHGIRRTNEDKARTVLAFLSDREWKEWTDTTIARHCGVTSSMVGKYRSWLGAKAEAQPGVNGQQQRIFIGRDGNRRMTSVPAKSDEILEKVVRQEICPHCGQKMPPGMHGKRSGLKDRHARSRN